MKYNIQKLHYTNNTLSYTIPTKEEPTSNEIAIVIHVFYLDIWKEIETYLSKLDIEYNLFISVPEGTNENEIIKIFKGRPDINIFMTENRGRDVLPFLQIMDCIGINNYKYICKMHTKKTGDSALGNVWRKLLYFDLIGSNETVQSILNIFEKNKGIGIVTGKNTILDSQRYSYGNTNNIDLLAQKTGILYDEHYLFPAGTMFWTRSETIAPLVLLFSKNELFFEEELGQKDDTLAHAIERFFGIICQMNGQEILESPSDYRKLTANTLNELSTLVLSQQYAGLDMFITQKHAIEEKELYIQELKVLAESLRIKNRLKRLFPSNIKSKMTKSLKLFTVLKTNPQVVKKVIYYLSKGDIKYVWTKIKEKVNQNLTQSAQMIEVEPTQYFKPFNSDQYPVYTVTIDIIIPVYNGYGFLEKLFDSIEKNTSTPYRLIVINDCSPDKKVKPYLLERLKIHSNSVFIEHNENQGFLKSVNEAYTHVSGDFILLNTDTEVPKFWIERLMYPIVHMDNVASTTPFTNSGEIASFPNFVADNNIFDGLTVDKLDTVFRDVIAEKFYEEVPTGVGFCMGMNYALTEEISMFAADTFGKGYGEENDWCQRAIQKGYKNILVPNLFVYHKHGGSFTAEEKKELLKVNATKLLDRHPNYGKDVHTYIQKDPHNTLRHLLVLKAADDNVGTHLIFDHDLGGGANIYANELIEKYLKEGKNTLLVRYDYYSHTYKVFHHYKRNTFSFKISNIIELQEFISSLHLKEIFLNNLVSYKDIFNLLDFIHTLSSEKEIELIIPIHDYFSLSPSYNLLNKEGKYSIADATDNENMNLNMQEWRNFYQEEIDMIKWKSIWNNLLMQSSNILCFSNSSKDTLTTVYSTIKDNKIEVIPHTTAGISPVSIKKYIQNTTLTIGVLGAINYVKGSHIIKQLIQLIERDTLDINIVVIGELTEHVTSKHLNVTGKYERENLTNIIQDSQIDIFLIPSIWPETFSYTTQEIMMMELPLMVFNLGAPAERVKKYTEGYIIQNICAESVIETANIFLTSKN